MFGEYSLPAYLIVGVVVVLAVGSLFPPIVSRSGSTDATAIEVATKAQELDYCKSNLDGVNCTCFAGVSGHILSQDTPNFRGTVAANREDLARGQASQSC